MSEPKTYTAKDIERYHRGEMSAAEMHLLEKAALDDPALADMLEGYAFTTTASADLHNLQKKVAAAHRAGRKRRRYVFRSAVAADCRTVRADRRWRMAGLSNTFIQQHFSGGK